MNWLRDFVRPRIQSILPQKDVGEHLWHKCEGCGKMIFHLELAENLHICPDCDHHLKLPAKERLSLLFDEGVYESLPAPEVPADPLKFRDTKRYNERLKAAQTKHNRHDCVQLAKGEIQGQSAVVGVFDFAFMGGSMGTAAGQAIVEGAQLAAREKLPYIVFVASGGARMQEGILSLMQMPRTIIAIEQLKEAGLPFINVLTHPTTGGVSASFAMLGDVHLAEPGAIIGFAGARVIQQTIREELPEGFQRSEYLHEHGMVDRVVRRPDLPTELNRLLRLLQGNGSGVRHGKANGNGTGKRRKKAS